MTGGMMDSSRHDAAHAAVERNIQAVAKLELAERLRRTKTEHLVDRLASWAGNPAFPMAHAVWFAIWVGYNTWRPDAFDPFPFTLLALLVSLEAIMLTSFVLASQELMNKEADRRAKLNLQIDMLAEQELTAILKSIAALAKHSGVDLTAAVPDFHTLTSDTRVDRLAKSLDDTETKVAEESASLPPAGFTKV
jgi:uncharacterized membrane protein